ncbi:MAG: hypothetical protein ABIY52_10005, partial [Gemmatimonadaceae bacterium]
MHRHTSSTAARWAVTLGLALLGQITGASPACAQIETVGAAITSGDQAPPGLRWRRISTPRFEVVFPAAFDAQARRVAATLERLSEPLGRTMGGPPRRLTVVLQTQSATSNGYAALGPRRSVWYTTPPDFEGLLGTGEWLTLLASHETRHVTQMDRANTGFTRFAGLVLGDMGQTLMTHLAIPGWAWEGDAVGTETALTHEGRGRMPAFDKEIRALALAGRLPSYRQALNGSLTRHVPDEYPLGFVLTTYLRRTQDADIVGRLFARGAASAFDPLAFEHAVKHETGLSMSAVYDSAMADLSRQWSAQVVDQRITPARLVTARNRVWTSYEYPQFLSNGSLVAVRFGLADAPTLVLLDTAGRELPLLLIAANGGLRASGTRVTWAETVVDPRWGSREWSEIREYDVATRRLRSVTTKTRFFAPALSPDLRRIAAVEQSTTMRSALVVLDAQSGRELSRHPAPNGILLRDPSWSDDGRSIVFISQGEQGKAIVLIDPDNGVERTVVAATREDVARPTLHGRSLFFNAPLSGLDAIYVVDVQTGLRRQVVARGVAASQPTVSPDGCRMVFADYTADGSLLSEVALDSATWLPMDRVAGRAIDYAGPLAKQEGGVALDTIPLDTAAMQAYRVRPYGTAGLFAVHSWYPVLDAITSTVGASIVSTNVLNTLGAEVGYRYNRTERAGAVEASVSYAGLYPIIDVGLKAGTRASSYEDATGSPHAYAWRENSVIGALRLPLDFSRGATSRTLALGMRAELVDISDLQQRLPFSNGDGRFSPITVAADLENVRRKAPRDIRSPWAQQARLFYSSTPFGGDYAGRSAGAIGRLDLPGLARHHGLRLSGAIEQRSGTYHFESEMPVVRGFDYRYHDRMVRGSAEYRLPLAYPDLALGSVLYVKRLQGEVFHDR